MTAVVSPEILGAAKQALEEARDLYWRPGERVVRGTDVVALIRLVRVGAKCNEDKLPKVLGELLTEARFHAESHDTMKLSKVMDALNAVVLA